MKGAQLILIDGNALLYRAFYAVPRLTTKKGIPTGGIYGFTRIIMKLFQEQKPNYAACAFDKGKKTFRHKQWEKYKVTRPETPHELALQIPLAQKILKGFRIPIFQDEEYEADDILATLAKKAEQSGLTTDIFTGDKDILQVVSDYIRVVQFKKGISQTKIFNPRSVEETYGIAPEQIADYLSLVGDVSDNIPGVAGIGPKTATKLLQEFGNTEKILLNLDKIPSKLVEKIKGQEAQVKLSKKLATIITDVPLEFDLESLKIKHPDNETLITIFKELEFNELIKKLNAETKETKEVVAGKKVALMPVNKSTKTEFIVYMDKKPSELKIYLSACEEENIIELNLNQEFKSSEFERCKEILSSKQIKKIGTHLKQTSVNLRNFSIDLQGIEFDIAIAAYLLDPSARDYSLNKLCVNFLNESPANLSMLTPARKIQYIKKLYRILKQELELQNMHHLFYTIEMPLIRLLADMERRGIKIDLQSLEHLLHEIQARITTTKKDIYEIAGTEFNIDSYKELSNILFKKLNLPPVKKTKTGYSTNEDVIRALSAINPDLQRIIDYRYLSKLKSSYIKPLCTLINTSTGRIHTSFSQITTATGRLASLKPNLQNIPIKEELGYKIRKCFVADKEYLFVAADYSQVELRILAHLSGDKNLISAFIRGDDIHRETAAEIFNVLPLQVTPPMRKKAKMVNFGIIYGISYFGLAQSLRISEKEAAEYINLYFSRYPGVKTFIHKTVEEAQEKGCVYTIMGRKRYTSEINSQNTRKRKLAARIAVNSRIQGSAADLIKLAMLNIYNRLQEEKLPAWIILQIHDELLIEAEKSKIDEVRKILKKEMESALNLSVPIVANTKIGSNWAEMHY